MDAPFPTLYDNHGRPLQYLRLAVTDRCNLRCFYCMPAEGIPYLPKKELLRYEEMERLVTLLAQLGIRKVRITGGEPFVRRDLVPFMERLSAIPGIEQLNLTTNGVLTQPHVPALKAMGVGTVNLSLDTLDRQRFLQITRRDEFDRVWATYESLLEHNIAVKINAVVMEGQNIDDILPLVELTRHQPVDIRFIEEMPFNGEGNHYPTLTWTYKRIFDYLRTHYPDLQKVEDHPNSTAHHYVVPGYQGRIGIIAAFSRTFCGTCNRLRITAQGGLKTCLYDQGVLDLRALLRSDASDEQIKTSLIHTFRHRAKDGFEAERQRTPVTESMATIGG
ncbi:cyclic pyranopterin phosphate synthase [Catalinimonas alkaloidigena]|uniref:GTP 3',8-cyclase n=1 Tax=Catalinimonas alkaloidigena TaxID=1075417 RepID=A0A1G9EMG5_9BACT|nr:GTP 3',8-cyclase MoaA [Catalinimonas alkaloidigena]SDK77372.1 cyclic pyranopterin phosphate synthase [Catalinimonas alkaloidigena]